MVFYIKIAVLHAALMLFSHSKRVSRLKTAFIMHVVEPGKPLAKCCSHCSWGITPLHFLIFSVTFCLVFSPQCVCAVTFLPLYFLCVTLQFYSVSPASVCLHVVAAQLVFLPLSPLCVTVPLNKSCSALHFFFLRAFCVTLFSCHHSLRHSFQFHLFIVTFWKTAKFDAST